MYTVRIENNANGIVMSTKKGGEKLTEKKLSCPIKKNLSSGKFHTTKSV
jgi:hypothetical protein